MATETIIWTGIPYGVITLKDGQRMARISVVASHRLEAPDTEGDTLSLYPIALNWTQHIRDNLQGFVVRAGTHEVKAELQDRHVLDPNWWAAMFNEKTFVRPYAFEDHTDKLIISYPTQNIVNTLKGIYQAVGFDSPDDLPDFRGRDSSTGQILNIPFNDVPWNKDIAQGMRAQLKAGVGDNVWLPPSIDVGAAGITGDPVNDLQKLMLFHYPANQLGTTLEEDKANVTQLAPPLPKTEEDFERYMDYHEVISSLGDYPELMRRLGLIVDILVPVDDVPVNTHEIRVAPLWDSPEIENRLIGEFPRTAVIWKEASDTFLAQPREASIPQIEDGQLVINPNQTYFDLVQVDVDGAGIKLVNFLNNMASAEAADMLAVDSPGKQGLPTMRSAGFSLNLTARDLIMYEFFNKTADDNQLVEKGVSEDLLFYAEDLLRGYRVDMWDTLSSQWHSLCQRVGNYNIEGTDLSWEGVPDEGFAQMGMSQAAETEEGQPPATDDFYLHESMFRWEGWSLVAPRPGKTIGEQGDTNSPMADPQPQPMMPFKLITTFKAASRSLPRLRFGTGYRMRVRVADLAGNSVSLNDASDSLVAPAAPDEPEVYYRFEPLSPPSIFLREEITFDDAGESVAHMVIRSFNSSPDLDNAPVSDTNERHIAAPPTSQLMAETHGVFDDMAGRLKNDPSTYNIIASRDLAVDTSQTKTPIIPEPQMELPYLPDALAMGAAFRNLPGTPDDEVWGKVDGTGQLAYDPVPGVLPRPGTMTHIPFLPADTPQLPDGLLALYTFEEGSGNVVHDVSGVGDPLDLTIADPGNVTWGTDNLTIDTATIIASAGAANKLNSGIQATNEITIEMWIQPSNDLQSGPARIATISQNPSLRNVTVGQGMAVQGDPLRGYVARLRTTETTQNGLPPLNTPDNLVTTTLTHLVFTRDLNGDRTLYIDGMPAAADNITGNFSNWDAGYQFGLGNEFTMNRPWLGTYHMVGVYNRALTVDEVLAHFNSGTTMPTLPPDAFDRLLSNTPFRLILAEHPSGDFALPEWDNVARTLTVFLPKAEDIRRPMSTYMHPEHLKLMGVWAWIREYIEQQTQIFMSNPSSLEYLTKKVVDCVQYALEGSHWMLTPSRKLAFVHAVQQPLGQPRIGLMLPVRYPGATNSGFAAITEVHGKSTLNLNLIAKWTETLDDLNNPGPTTKSVQEAVEEINIKSLEVGNLFGSKQEDNGKPKPIATYQPQQDWVVFNNVGFNPPSPLHEFGDTKHREITYHMVAGSRFREYFAADVPGGFTRNTNEVTLHVPSSARPPAPRVEYVMPTYGWKREETTNIIGSYRQGGGLRVYLDRPWYQSGDGELLGVILWPGYSLTNEERQLLKRHITQWGIDPIRVS
ncbi:MAG: LamG domain-containing protein, partial [Anaerolineae bacterium]|nr:LamG domain-containing protein [Anaerolineae bacterium]